MGSVDNKSSSSQGTFALPASQSQLSESSADQVHVNGSAVIELPETTSL